MDILQAYIDIGVMMQKSHARTEKELRQHYKVLVCLIMNDCCHVLPLMGHYCCMGHYIHTHKCIQFVMNSKLLACHHRHVPHCLKQVLEGICIQLKEENRECVLAKKKCLKCSQLQLTTQQC